VGLRHLLHFGGGLLRYFPRLLGGVGRRGRGLRLGGLCLRRGLEFSNGRERFSELGAKRMGRESMKSDRRSFWGMAHSMSGSLKEVEIGDVR